MQGMLLPGYACDMGCDHCSLGFMRIRSHPTHPNICTPPAPG
jgi:hypothetical protein